MAEWQILDSFPPYAARGSDYFTGSDVGDIDETFDGTVRRRRERIMVTPAEIDYEGVVCLGERTVRYMAREFGMVDGWRAAQLIADNDRLTADRDRLSAELGQALEQIAYLRAQQSSELGRVYVAVDGTVHGDLAAAMEVSERLLTGQRPKAQRGVAPLTEAEAPKPPVKKGTRR
jgi:hypothetical protein